MAVTAGLPLLSGLLPDTAAAAPVLGPPACGGCVTAKRAFSHRAAVRASRSRPRPRAVAASRQRRRSWSVGQEAQLDISSIGLHRAVFAGGQGTLDEGLITHYTGSDHFVTVGAGQIGVYWLAGHHSTHGAPFRALTSVGRGDTIRVTRRDGSTVVYRVTQILRTGTWISDATYYGPQRGVARLMMQTCLGASVRLLVFGTRIA